MFYSFMILALGKDLEKKLSGVSQGWAALHTGIPYSPLLPSCSQFGGLAFSIFPSASLLTITSALWSLVLPSSGTLIFWAMRNGLPLGAP